jgi:ribosomal protein L11 methyltransferase
MRRFQSLWQISIVTSAEGEEAVSAWVERLFSTPVSVYADAETGQIIVSVYLEKANAVAAKRALRSGLQQIAGAGINPTPGTIIVKKLARQNWAESWKRHFKPINIGRSLLIKPSWSRRRPAKNQAVVVLDPGLSFGTGQHATTGFCLRRLVECRRPAERQSFLDMGSGSGILSIAAAKLGYSPVDAFDFDPEAVRVSRINAQRNRIAEKIKIAQQDLTRLPQRSSRRYDVICANLIYDLLVSQAEKICARLKPGGHLILAGILQPQFAMVESTYKKIGLTPITSYLEKEWESVEFVLEKNF